ncbi:hypothetical protein TPHA_0C00100 [Tetrapisispora phaffii CBS 4417]|uniref:Pre-rRNA-processing protein ESF2 n=1 Tax=Tetrapisispora phaffii (strain ATCC 24235 / CBS 4417 / NBRC 1672 / NRRL Y-8282 / UCD 70-5) TaxID=1071381 RepID=G8BQZ1_TETPH|nr:hypothetical protein TPHA_0C00100 [Tetrapisispora phaffii CBS 4417]CCE62167.1 hypothetical protein TPHA_0C00100 [Tetrapisispora phaffii CBS 4417]
MSNQVEEFDDFSSDGEDNGLLIQSKKNFSSKQHIEEDVESSDDRDSNDDKESGTIKQNDDVANEKSDDDASIDDKLDEGKVEINSGTTENERKEALKKKMDAFNTLKAQRKARHKTGVIYLSAIPPYMKPAKMRQILSRFGELDRLFLKRESDQKYKSRVKGGGNKKTKYEEGWAEFVRKRDAKICAGALNGNTIGGSKGSFYHDDILNVKYLPGFKWADLTDQIARENDVRQSKLDLEISQANKMNAEFIRNVEKSKMLENIKKSNKRKNNDIADKEDNTIVRNFKQYKVSTRRADASDDIKAKQANMDQIINNLL